ncbi:tetraspanin-9-like [Acropora muricata]|uniref:tetraspanin-9-like n=1 Tax=Acropora muricata TaxID=159855 RepID=UPI0034E47202
MEGGAKVIKYLVVFFNFLFFIFGCVLVGVGAWSLIKIGDFNDLTEGSYSSAATVMIVAGVLIALISFFGCCGAWKENRCLLIMFFICLLVILIIEITFAVLGYINRNKVDDAFDKGMENIIQQKYGAPDMMAITDSVDKLQQQEMCCGWINFTDWYISNFTNGEHKVPDSCCEKQSKDCGKEADTNNNIYKVGCKTKLEGFIKDKLYHIGALGVTVVVIQILGMIFALVLACRIESEGKYA